MDFELDSGQRAWRDEIREFLKENVTPDVLRERADHGVGPHVAAFRGKAGDKGWWGLNRPAENGGLGPICQHFLVNEFEYRGAPGPDLMVTSVSIGGA